MVGTKRDGYVDTINNVYLGFYSINCYFKMKKIRLYFFIFFVLYRITSLPAAIKNTTVPQLFLVLQQKGLMIELRFAKEEPNWSYIEKWCLVTFDLIATEFSATM